MTREEAAKLVQGFFKEKGGDSPGLNAKGLGGASLPTGDIYFEYLPEPGALKCSARVYRFHGIPEPKVLAAFQEEEKTTDTGGGRFEYEPVNRGVYLARTYGRPVEAKVFAAELDRLLEASEVWREQVVVRVSDRAYGRKR